MRMGRTLRALLASLAFAAAAQAAQCNDGIDNNSNGAVDMTDWYCKTPLDNDESSFYSAVLGDDANFPKSLDCWFDLNTGSGDDGCSMHACCDISGACPADLDPANFNPAQCAATQTCRDVCLPQAKAGCDCWGCCEIYLPGSACATVFVNPTVSPTCTLDALGDPTTCRPCTQNPTCLNPSHIFIDGFEPPGLPINLLDRLPSLESLVH